MPDEIEVPTEHLHETLMEEKEHAEKHGGGHSSSTGASWISQVAVSSALLAVLAAITALLAGHHANEAMLEQMQATDQWAFYQAKGIKSAVLETRIVILEALGKEVKPEERAKLTGYEDSQKKIEEKGTELESSSRAHMERHNTLARGVTIFQIAIALGAIAVLMRRRPLWYVSVGLGLIGSYFLVRGII